MLGHTDTGQLLIFWHLNLTGYAVFSFAKSDEPFWSIFAIVINFLFWLVLCEYKVYLNIKFITMHRIVASLSPLFRGGTGHVTAPILPISCVSVYLLCVRTDKLIWEYTLYTWSQDLLASEKTYLGINSPNFLLSILKCTHLIIHHPSFKLISR